jgi:hypothetical protein
VHRKGKTEEKFKSEARRMSHGEQNAKAYSGHTCIASTTAMQIPDIICAQTGQTNLSMENQ